MTGSLGLEAWVANPWFSQTRPATHGAGIGNYIQGLSEANWVASMPHMECLGYLSIDLP